jgi:hypothetical protein
MPYTSVYRVSDWLSCEHWEDEGVTHVKFVETRNPAEVGSQAKLVIDCTETSAVVETQRNKKC